MEKSRNSPIPLNVREERIAQNMLFDPRSSIDALIDYEQELLGMPHYAVMVKKRPQMAAKQIARHLRKTAFAAISNHAFTAVLHDIVPALEAGKPLCPEPNVAPFTISHSVPTKDNRPFTGAAATYLWATTDILSKGWNVIVDQLRQPDSPCAALWEAFEVAQQMCKYAQPFYTGSPYEQCMLIAQDNGITSLELLTHLRTDWAELSYAHGNIPTAENTTLWSLQNADTLGWGATANVNALGKFIHADRLSEIFTTLEEVHPTEYPTMLAGHYKLMGTDDEAMCPRIAYTHHSLQDGPWEHERFCPAPLTLVMPDPADQDIMRRFNDHCDRLLGIEPVPAASEKLLEDRALMNRATVLLQIGSLVGRETIFSQWPDGFHDDGVLVADRMNG